MPGESCVTKEPKGLGFFEKYLTVWLLLCIGLGILLGNFAPELARYLDSLSIYIEGAPVISIRQQKPSLGIPAYRQSS